MTEASQHHPEAANIIEDQTIVWSKLSGMMRELDSIRKRMADNEQRDAAEADLGAFAASVSIDLGTMISGENPYALADQIQDALRAAAQEAERKIAVAQGKDYTPDTPQ